MNTRIHQLAQRTADGVQIHPHALRVAWALNDLPTADAHTVNCRFAASVRVADNPADRRMFSEIFLSSRDSVTPEIIAAHFADALRSRLATLCVEYKAADVIRGDHQTALLAAITQATTPLAFAAGLEFVPPFQLDVQSPSLQRQTLQHNAHLRQQQDIQRATQLLQQFQALRQSAPQLSAGQLLQQLNAADRGAALQALLLASSSESTTKPLWAVAGQTLVRIDPRSDPPAMEVAELPDALGPLRSVQGDVMDGQPVLLVGARSGVMVVPPENLSDARLFALPNLQSQLGFNRVVCRGEEIWASHSEAGIVMWNAGQTHAPQAGPLNAPVNARNLHLVDDTWLISSAANELVLLERNNTQKLPAQSTAAIVAIVPAAQFLVAVHQDGTLVTIDRGTREIADIRRRGVPLSAAGAMPWLGEVRLLLAESDGAINCVGIDDSLVSEFCSPYRGMKDVSATADRVAAVSSDRQRIVLWETWNGAKPLAEIHVTSRVKHRVADVVFA